MDNVTPIFLSPQDAILFLEFQKRYLFMKALEVEGIFKLKSGSVEIHFNNLGEIAAMDIHRHLRLPI